MPDPTKDMEGAEWLQEIRSNIAELFNAAALTLNASDAEAQAKSITNKALVPGNLAAIGSSATFAGLVELATNAEAKTGTDTVRAVTPDDLMYVLNQRFGVDDAEIVVGAEAGHVINVAIQLEDHLDADLAVRASVMAYLSNDATGDSVCTTAPTTVAIGTDGVAIPLVAGKCFLLCSESDGDIDINITNATALNTYLVIVLPNGKHVCSGIIANAG